jgi:surface polysaccharide O-acyltransferase-like enzyme
MKETRPFLRHIHYFRAFAIISIIIVHTWIIPSQYRGIHKSAYTLVDSTCDILFHDSTIYFIFISGFLFCYLSPKFEILKYYKSKLFNVISPYIFMTLFVATLQFIKELITQHTIHFSAPEILSMLIHGTAQVQYWYIPFIALVFVISPFLLKIPTINSKYFLLIISILPLFGTRTGTDLSIWQYVYFLPIYLQGMYFAMNYSLMIEKIKKWKVAIVLSLVSSTVFLIHYQLNPYHYQFGIINIFESLFYVQKASIAMLVLLFLQKLENTNYVWLDKIAKFSFALYFTHRLISDLIPTYQLYHIIDKSALMIFLVSILHVIIVIPAALFACMGIQKLLGKRSRFFIGA